MGAVGTGLAIAQQYVRSKRKHDSSDEMDEMGSTMAKDVRDKALAEVIVQMLSEMGFKEVVLPSAGHKEKVYQFQLKYHDQITIMTSISKTKRKSDSAVFCRKTIRIGLMDKFRDWVVHSHFPRRASVEHHKGTVKDVLDAA